MYKLEDKIAILYEVIFLNDNIYTLRPINSAVGSINDDGVFIDSKDGTSIYSFNDGVVYKTFENEDIVCYGHEMKIADLLSCYEINPNDEDADELDDIIEDAIYNYMDSLAQYINFIVIEDTFDDIPIVTNIPFMKDQLFDISNNQANNEFDDKIYFSISDLVKLVDKNDPEVTERVKKFLGYLIKENLIDSDGNVIDKNVNINSVQKEYEFKNINFDDFERFLKSRIIGQDEQLERIATSIAMNYRTRNPKNLKKILLLGPTGVGKTETFQAISEYLDIPFTIYPTSSITQNGYEGDNFDNVFYRIFTNSGKDLKRAENSIIFFEEFDKIAKRGASVNDEAVQNLLLKFIDGQKYDFSMGKNTVSSNGSPITIDTSLMTIVAAGAFTDVYDSNKNRITGFSDIGTTENKKITKEDLIKYGMIRELIGRFSTIVEYNSLSREDLYNILKTSTCSPLENFKSMIMESFGVEIVATGEYFRKISDDAYNLKTGARSLKEKIEDSVYRIERFLLKNRDDIKSIILNEDTAKDPHKFLIKK